jgi:mRNA-degrading endonuclease YafQ of YafQ-DinJ toxin-antitoxin module
MEKTYSGTGTWKGYREPPVNPDYDWVFETIKGAFSYTWIKTSYTEDFLN